MRLYKVSSSENFLQALYEGIKGRFPKEDIPKLTILLPNKNSCYNFTRVFYDNLKDDSSSLLPKILPLGEISETSLLSANGKSIFRSKLPKPISFEEQVILITKLIKTQLEANNYSPSDVVQTAEQITKLIMKFRIDDVKLCQINRAIQIEYSEHLSLYREILEFVSEIWPEYMRKHKLIDSIEYRNLFIREIIEQDLLNSGKTIIAGSTGSIKSTRKLIKYLLEGGGYFVTNLLGGYNSKDHWLEIDERHPNYCIRDLFQYLGYSERDVPSWSETPEKKEQILSYFIKKEQVSLWNLNHPANKQIELLEVNNIFEEAFSIAFKCQMILQDDQEKKILIMSGNDNLTNNLEKILRIINLSHRNIKGKCLSDTDEYIFIENLAKFAEEKFSIISLLSLLKNKFFSLGHTRSELNEIIEELERKYLRKICIYENFEYLINCITEENIKHLLEKFYNAILTLKKKFIYLEDYCKELLISIKTITLQSEKVSFFLSSKAGQEIISSINEIQNFSKVKTKYPTKYLRLILFNSIKKGKIFGDDNNEASITISTPIDSRLDHSDYVILADFNNNSWPLRDRSDPWLNEQIYASLGLSHEKLKDSLASYDLATLLCKNNVMISRSKIIDGSPTRASVWLERIKLFESKTKQKILKNNQDLHDQIQNLYRTDIITPYQPEEIYPHADVRPKELAVTQIEKLMRDPYSIYALKILKLKKLDEIDRDPNQADFGNFIHSTLDKFNKSKQDPNKFLEELISLGQREIKKFGKRPLIHKIWWPCFMEIAHWYEKFEKLRHKNDIKTISEKEGYIILHTQNGPFKLKAKADQIEINGHSLTIIDFKTGIVPSNIDILSGFSPQMTLEAVIASAGGFGMNSSIISAKYIQFSSGKNFGKISEIKNLKEIIQIAQDGVTDLIELYSSDKQPYLICPKPSKYPNYNDYQHLERIDEFM